MVDELIAPIDWNYRGSAIDYILVIALQIYNEGNFEVVNEAELDKHVSMINDTEELPLTRPKKRQKSYAIFTAASLQINVVPESKFDSLITHESGLSKLANLQHKFVVK